MDVVLQYFDDCPNWRVVDDHLCTLAREFTDVTVIRQLVETPEEARRVGFRSSPTILLDGVDPFAAESDPVGGLSCRVYRTPDGPAGSPTLDQLRREFVRVGASYRRHGGATVRHVGCWYYAKSDTAGGSPR